MKTAVFCRSILSESLLRKIGGLIILTSPWSLCQARPPHSLGVQQHTLIAHGVQRVIQRKTLQAKFLSIAALRASLDDFDRQYDSKISVVNGILLAEFQSFLQIMPDQKDFDRSKCDDYRFEITYALPDSPTKDYKAYADMAIQMIDSLCQESVR